ncbi:substrate-binding domain-containing protein [Pelomonas sp. SE-A7]|uniref:substrate-binding domain-containing protein n=1 Tax=Pelomonas sp. SE-A7 TaxID=3054953 RepID=UPI00259CF05F|nr:substrate-binding domain-containing protein [Pelomonas sp. SE-A7]MDM4765776.1 substrate-binding domain-containing protein [Pelomonas sp. SE-A7]
MTAIRTLALALATAALACPAAHAAKVGVSWSNFQEERWKTDEAALKAQLARTGDSYLSADAAGSPEKQLADIDGLIAKGAQVLVILAMDKDAILPALRKAAQRKIPVIAYDRLIEAPGVFYISFDNKEVGRLQARAVLAAKPKGRFVIIKGSASDPNSDFLRAGQQEVLEPAIKKGEVQIVGEEYTEGWRPEVAQKNMEQILTRTGGKVDAVIAANDGTAGGVVAALAARGIKGLPLSGQDGDHAALNRVALGLQTVSVWKDARQLGQQAAAVASSLAARKPVEGMVKWTGGDKKLSVDALFLKPVPVTRENLDLVVGSGWIGKAELCKGVAAAGAPAACK